MARARWDQAGITDVNTGALARPVERGVWHRPAALNVVGRELRWDLDLNAPDAGEPVSRHKSMLSGFVALAVAADSVVAVLKYASRWGLLGLCGRHGLPMTHPPLAGEPRDTRLCEQVCKRHGLPVTHPPVMADSPSRRICSAEAGSGVEPIDRWVFYAKHARATLDVAASLFIERGRGILARDLAILRTGLTPAPPSQVNWADWWGSTGDPDDEDGWAAAKVVAVSRADLAGPSDPVAARDREAAAEVRFRLRLALVEWLDLAAIHPTINLESGNPLLLAGDGLFGALALQLVLMATKTAGVAVCASCGEPYSLDRAPAPAPKRHYCTECRANGAYKRFAMAKLRAKKRASATSTAESSVPADQ